ncbi:hypothetical protein Aperf_G00000098269 [Anoplocephala perfoliata]
MDLEPAGCLFPPPNIPGLRVQDCTKETCNTHSLYSVVSARCPLGVNSTPTPNSNSFSTSVSSSSTSSSVRVVRTRCMVNRTAEVFYWLPPVQDCFSARSGETPPYFYGSIYTLRQLQQAFQAGKAAAVAVREKPLVSLSVGMSALSVVLVLIMLLGVCHRNAPDIGSGSGSSGRTAVQRQRQAARRRARARSRRRENANHNSIGTQADVIEPSDLLFILPQAEFTRRAESGGVNAGFNDSEALFAQPQGLSDQTPALLSATHEGDSTPEHDPDPPASNTTEQQEGAGGGGGGDAPVSNTGLEDELSRLSCLAIPHIDIPPAEYQPQSSQPPKILKVVPKLPSYEDATKRGMYCIIRPTDITAPPAYQFRISDGASIDGSNDNATDSGNAVGAGNIGDSTPTNVFPHISSWDFGYYGVHRGSVNSMPEFSRLYGPPESPYPGDSPQ